MDNEQLTDEVLMKRISARDSEAFRLLYSRYADRIFNFILRYSADRMLAEDLLQETWWRIWQAAGTYDPGRGEVRTWLYQVAVNATRSALRKRSVREDRTNGSSSEPTRDTADSALNPAAEFEQQERARLVEGALSQLPPALREIIALRCLEGMKYKEIARVTGSPLGTLKSRLHRAVAELRRRLLAGEQ